LAKEKETVPQDRILKHLRENWFIVLFFGSLIISWTTYTNKVNRLEADIQLLTASQKETAAQYFELSEAITRIDERVEQLLKMFEKFDITYIP